MSSTVKKISSVLSELNVKVSHAEIETAANIMFARISKDAKVGGFRKGKIPRAILKRLFGKSVYSDLKSDIVSRYFLESAQEHDLNPISEPVFDAKEIEAGKDYSFKVTIEMAPNLETIVTEGIEIEKYKVKVDADQVKTELKRLRSALATAEELKTKRACKIGDLVKLNLKRFENGDWKDAGMPDQEMILEEGSAPTEFLDELPGLKTGEEKDISFGQPQADGEQLRFLCKIVSIKKRILPKLDDEFAKDVGDFETLKALKDDIKSRFKVSLDQQEDERLKHLLFDKLREKNPMELPPSILDRQSQAMRKQFDGIMDQVKQESADLSDNKNENEDPMAKLIESSNNAAKDIVHQHFLIQEIAKQKGLAVKDEDLEIEFAKMAKKSGNLVPKIKAEYAKNDKLSELKISLLERKVFDSMLSMVKITEVAPPAKDKEDDKKTDASKKTNG